MERITLTEDQRAELQALTRSRRGSAAVVRRARCILLWAAGERRVDMREKLACNDGFITRWTRAYTEQGLPGLVSFYPGRAPRQPLEKLEARVLNHTLKRKPRDGSTHWSTRKLAAELGDVSFMTVQRIWQKHGIRPHRLRRHMISNDPDFESKAADVIGLYLNPPEHAAVFCVDEKTASARPSRQARDPCDLRQRQQSRDAAHAGVPERASGGEDPLHAHPFVVAQPGRKPVLAHPAQRHRPRRVHQRQGPAQEDHEIHPRVQQERQAIKVEVR